MITEGQSERTNQTVEIALRFFLTENPGADWVSAVPLIQANTNNSPNASTGLCPNELTYGFRVRDTLSALTDKPASEQSTASPSSKILDMLKETRLRNR
jgi:hypothetical protein